MPVYCEDCAVDAGASIRRPLVSETPAGECSACGRPASVSVDDAMKTPAGKAVAAVSKLLGHGDAEADDGALEKTLDDIGKADDGGVVSFTFDGRRWAPGGKPRSARTRPGQEAGAFVEGADNDPEQGPPPRQRGNRV